MRRVGVRGRAESGRGPVALYAVLAVVAVLAGLVFTAGARAQQAALAVHQTDRSREQVMLADLTDQYLEFNFSDLARFATLSAARAAPGAARAALARILSTDSMLIAVTLTDPAGKPIAGAGQPVPAIGSPGYLPLIADLRGGRPGLSGVLAGSRGPLLAMAVPLAAGQPAGLLIGYADLHSWPLEGYVRRINLGPQTTYRVLDAAGEVVASSRIGEIGSRWRLPAPLARGRGGAAASGGNMVSAAPVGLDGWTAAASQPIASFDAGLLEPFHWLLLALALLLVAAAVALTASEHRRRQALGQLADEATIDPLTGAGTRRLLEARLAAALLRSARSGRGVGVAFCDIDDFKGINDRYGHAAGDQVLRATAARLRECLRPHDLVARVGGDEFVTLIEGVPADLDALASRIREACHAPVASGGRPVTPTVSVGLAVLPPQGFTAAEALHAADSAMYEAKRSGGDAHVVVRLSDAPGPAAQVPQPRPGAGEPAGRPR